MAIPSLRLPLLVSILLTLVLRPLASQASADTAADRGELGRGGFDVSARGHEGEVDASSKEGSRVL